ncbi:MAG: SMC-Scp complex subunit ScpB [Candidatus Omnitrophica bacterium]|nr:SMC-Scp complex subunit ScpB [Candidatus Omnitrophota bacterium]
MTNEEAKKIIEALLFASDRPVGVDEITAVLEDVDSRVVRELVYELKAEYESQQRSFGITEVAGGFQLVSDTYYAPWIKKLLTSEKAQRLSMPSLETLAIIAYKQPLTRSDIEIIRGVNIDGVIENLLEKNLIKTHGRKEAPGRPFFYATTEEFLVYFGLRSLQDLPPLKEFTEKDIELGDKGVIVQKPQEEAAKDGTNEPAKTD